MGCCNSADDKKPNTKPEPNTKLESEPKPQSEPEPRHNRRYQPDAIKDGGERVEVEQAEDTKREVIVQEETGLRQDLTNNQDREEDEHEKTNTGAGRPEGDDTLNLTSTFTDMYAGRVKDTLALTRREYEEAMKAKSLIGFMLVENAQLGLFVSWMYQNGPAYQVEGKPLRTGHRIISVGGREINSLEDMREAKRDYCTVSKVTLIVLEREDGSQYEVPLWIMTDDNAHAGKPYYFDKSASPKVFLNSFTGIETVVAPENAVTPRSYLSSRRSQYRSLLRDSSQRSPSRSAFMVSQQ